ncbi:alpha/beta hydrolase family protein [Nocardia sp. NPDC058705]|uniref:alpha/beta hydrolase family protein n=1 Tax=Nocardia sp. NPDC058705 TaxID=3346609 RepID=UPI0036CE28D0
MIAAIMVGAPVARAGDITTTDITFTRSDATITNGTIHAPAGATGRPGVVLVHGSGTEKSPQYDQVAAALAREGIVALRYDKRAENYTPAHRDYSLLADDALSAVAALRNRTEVDPAKVGIWGLSEGGWVAPLAVSRSADAAFLITIGANSGAPAAQQTWANETRFEAAGVRGSMVDVLGRNGIRVMAGAGLFAQADYNPLPVLARIQQPVLGIWGELDRLTPPGDSLRGFQEVFDRAGKTNYALRTLENAQHGGFTTTDGFDKGDELAPGYAQLMGDWVNGLPGSANVQADPPAAQGHSVTPLSPLKWWESPTAQLILLAVTVLALLGYALTGFVEAWRLPSVAPARILLAASVIGIMGAFAQLLFVASSRATEFGPLLFGRTLPWVALQVIACGAVVALGFVVVRRPQGTGQQIRWAMIVCAGIGFTLWSVYWGLLRP